MKLDGKNQLVDSSSPPVHNESKGGCVNMQYKGLHSLSVNIVVAGTSLCTNAGSSFLLSHCNYSGSMDICTHVHIFSYCTMSFFVSGLTKINTSF